jgi:Putative sensor
VTGGHAPTLLIHFPFNAATVYLIGILYFEGLIGALYPVLWQLSGPVQRYNGNGVVAVGLQLFPARSPRVVEMPPRFTLHVGAALLDIWPRALAACAAGIVVLLAVPWLVRGLARVDLALVRALLGPTEGSRRVARLEAGPGRGGRGCCGHAARDRAGPARRHPGATGGAGHEPRGPQGTPRVDRVGRRGGRPRGTSHARAKEALAELRSIADGIHPPALDLGLDNALTTLAARSVVPAVLRAELTTPPTDAVATIAYYSVAELHANVAKHSGADLATITVTEQAGRLFLCVTDDGRGGADPANGTGLAGLSGRLSAVDGSLSVHSPPGGPTVVTAELPLMI